MDPLASFYFGFLLRMAMVHHCTWFINSLCHTIGAKTYARELSAVDNAALAMLTFGEGTTITTTLLPLITETASAGTTLILLNGSFGYPQK